MKVRDLYKYSKLYLSADSMGSSKILRRYLKLADDFPIPMSIAHGVDFQNSNVPLDVGAIEPIHWSTSYSMYDLAKTIKPTLIVPHPWVILKKANGTTSGRGTLVIGPPPGASNDIALYNSLQRSGIHSYDILLKSRGATGGSRKFWAEKGIQVVTAGSADQGFYERLYVLINGYSNIVGCTVSSALFFAASLGKSCSVLEDYQCSFYDVFDYLKQVKFNSLIGKNFVRALINEENQITFDIAESLLGAQFIGEEAEIKTRLFDSIEKLTYPVHHTGSRNQLVRNATVKIALVTGKTGLLQNKPLDYFCKRISSRVSLININEVDIWLNGLNEKNFHAETVAYIRSYTEPGCAVD